MGLADKTCVPCKGGVPPLGAEKIREMLGQLQPGWQINAQGHLEKNYDFKDFAQALAFVNRVGAVAEAEGHHPDLYVSWGRCRIEIWTHKIHGLTESDFYLAAKADRAYQPQGAAAR